MMQYPQGLVRFESENIPGWEGSVKTLKSSFLLLAGLAKTEPYD